MRLNAVLRRCRRLGYIDSTGIATVEELYREADEKLFKKIRCNFAHVLQPLLQDRSTSIGWAEQVSHYD